jgi:Holliday junction resolvase RusA-like endonuclease
MSNKKSLRWTLEELQNNPHIQIIGNGEPLKIKSTLKSIDIPKTGKIIINLPPFPSPRMVRSDKWAKRPIVVKYFQWRKDFVLLCKQQGYTLQDVIDIVFIMQMPKSWSGRQKKIMDGRPHKQRPDSDNCLKSVMDSFGMEDGYVWDIHVRKYWGYDGKIIISRP